MCAIFCATRFTFSVGTFYLLKVLPSPRRLPKSARQAGGKSAAWPVRHAEQNHVSADRKSAPNVERDDDSMSSEQTTKSEIEKRVAGNE
jgi:hypothetical protein